MSKDSRIQDELSSSMTGGRLRRYAKVTSAMGGLAARLAGERYSVSYTHLTLPTT